MTDTRRPVRRNTTSQRAISAGLATATCIGVVGLLGVRTAEATGDGTDSATLPTTGSSSSTPAAPTLADLQQYEQSLADERQRLEQYRKELKSVAKQLKRQSRLLAKARGQAGAAPVQVPSLTTTGSPTKTTQKGQKPQTAQSNQDAGAPDAYVVEPPAPAASPPAAVPAAPRPAPAPPVQQAPKVTAPQSTTQGS